MCGLAILKWGLSFPSQRDEPTLTDWSHYDDPITGNKSDYCHKRRTEKRKLFLLLQTYEGLKVPKHVTCKCWSRLGWRPAVAASDQLLSLKDERRRKSRKDRKQQTVRRDRRKDLSAAVKVSLKRGQRWQRQPL